VTAETAGGVKMIDSVEDWVEIRALEGDFKGGDNRS
jgi:hypothetical protein